MDCGHLPHIHATAKSMSLENVSLSSKRVFPPLYIATGDPSKDKLAFIHILERLKVRIIPFMNASNDLMGINQDSKADWMG